MPPNMTVTGGVYEIRNIVDGNIYIGSSSDIKARWRTHKRTLKLNKHHNPYLQRSWIKHGEDCFSFSVIEYCETELLILREQYYIDTLEPIYNNSKIAGRVEMNSDIRKKIASSLQGNKNSYGTKRSQETIEKMSTSAKARKISQAGRDSLSAAHKGKPNGRLGTKHTPEALEKMSKAHKNISQATRDQMSLSQKGTKKGTRTQEQRDRMSAAKKEKMTDEVRARMSFVQNNMSEEAKLQKAAKVSAANKGHKVSAETLEKQSASMLKWWANKKDNG